MNKEKMEKRVKILLVKKTIYLNSLTKKNYKRPNNKKPKRKQNRKKRMKLKETKLEKNQNKITKNIIKPINQMNSLLPPSLLPTFFIQLLLLPSPAPQ